MEPTLTTLAPLLDRLFDEADRSSSPTLAAIPPEQLAHLARDRNRYAEIYHQLKDVWLPVSRETGRLLYLLARSLRARAVIEFGTSFGISTLHLAAALRDNGGGRLVTTELEPAKAERAAAHLAEAGLRDLVDIRLGDALQTLASDLPEAIDLVLLDGHKALYLDVLRELEPRLRPGALVLADNADFSPEYLAHVRETPGYLTTRVGDDVELSMWLA